jgi:hypothetical protein
MIVDQTPKYASSRLAASSFFALALQGGADARKHTLAAAS